MAKMRNFGTWSYWFAERYLADSELARWGAAYLPLNVRVEMLVRAGARIETVEKLQRMWDIFRCRSKDRANRETWDDTAIELEESILKQLR